MTGEIHEIQEDTDLICLCEDHGSYYSSVEGMLGLKSNEILNCPKCPKIKLNSDFEYKNLTKIFDTIKCECSEHGSFITNANKLIANNQRLVGSTCPKCPDFKIAVNNFAGTGREGSVPRRKIIFSSFNFAWSINWNEEDQQIFTSVGSDSGDDWVAVVIIAVGIGILIGAIKLFLFILDYIFF